MKSLSKVLLVLIVVSFLPISAWAQDDGPSWIRLNLVTVKPEYVDEFVELQKEITAGSKEQGVPFRAAWTMASFGTNYRFAFFSPMRSFADLDNPTPLDPALRAKFTKYISARESRASIYHADLSKRLPEGKTSTLAIVTIRTVATGQHEEFAEFFKNDIVPYMSAPETGLEGFVTFRTIFGPGADTWTTLAFIKDFAYIDGGPMSARTIDEAGRAALAQKEAGMVTNVQRFISRYVPELSYRNAAESTSGSNDRE